MSWDSDSGERFSDSDESAVEDIVDLTLPTPSPKKKKLITEFFKPQSVTRIPPFCIPSHTLISRRTVLMFRCASGCDPIPNCQL